MHRFSRSISIITCFSLFAFCAAYSPVARGASQNAALFAPLRVLAGYLGLTTPFSAPKTHSQAKSKAPQVRLASAPIRVRTNVAMIYTVNSNGDGGDGNTSDGACDISTSTPSGICTLRAAIEQANANSGADTINFGIPLGTPLTITPESALPAITEAVTIDGYTQSGASPNTKASGALDTVLTVVLDGTNAGTSVNGLNIQRAPNCHIKGLNIRNFTGSGILIGSPTATGNTVEGCFIGTNNTGTSAVSNNYGVGVFNGAQNNTIGGTTAAARNLISGNLLSGVNIPGTGTNANVVAGNLIGTNISGTNKIGNKFGVAIYNGAQNNTIGGTTVASRNVISGNSDTGINISDTGTNANVVAGNLIGTDVSGTNKIGNLDGIAIFNGAQSNTIGGTTAAARNVISGNTRSGVAISNANTNTNTLAGNYIGLNVGGGVALANDTGGVIVFNSAQSNVIGGATAASRNVISGNTGYGLEIQNGSDNSTVQNNYVGLNATGTTARGNSSDGVVLSAVGSTVSSNVISGNSGGTGLRMTGDGTGGTATITIQGNIIGLSADGSAKRPNKIGMEINSRDNVTVGGAASALRNTISGNTNEGISILNSITGTDGIIIQNNYIGINSSFDDNLGNGTDGVFIGLGTSDRIINNNIDGNVGNGIQILNSTGVAIQGNLLGTFENGNGGSGVLLSNGAEDSVIGGTKTDTAPGSSGNTISGNLTGVSVFSSFANSAGNTIRGNTIFQNSKLGINIDGDGNSGDGVTANDEDLTGATDDVDTGNNNLQNYPNITSLSGNNIIGNFHSTPNTNFYLDFYANNSADASGFGEGEGLLTSQPIMTDANGDATFSFGGNTLSGFITATATNQITGDTSEFSKSVTSSGAGITSFSPTSGPRGSIVTITGSGFTGATLVEFGGNNTSVFTVNSATKITATVPATAVTGKIRVTRPGGALTSATNFTVTPGYIVTNTNDVNAGSLREGINYANNVFSNNPTPPTSISFGIVGNGVHTIVPLSVLPAIARPTILDGATQPGFVAGGAPRIRLSGAKSGRGAALTITAADCAIRMLNIAGNGGSGILIKGTGAARNRIEGCYIGTNATGTAASPNGHNPGAGASAGTDGILLTAGAHDNIIGNNGSGDATLRNVISGNTGPGIEISNFSGEGADNNVIAGNYIGTTADGESPLGNGGAGVALTYSTTGNKIGLAGANNGNVISGQSVVPAVGIGISTNCFNNSVVNNLIGTDKDGLSAIPNQNGIAIGFGSHDNVIGGSTAERNVISGNAESGIAIGSGSKANTVSGNYIGTKSDGTTALGNGNGVEIGAGGPALAGALNNSIGGIATGEGNLIAFNSGDGVTIDNDGASFARGQSIRRNSIHDNGGLGINLVGGTETGGVTQNDTGDADTGANNLQNAPVITGVTTDSDSTLITGTLNSLANTAYKIELFTTDTGGEGQTYFGTLNVTTDNAGNTPFSTDIASVLGTGTRVTATATASSGDTSEFAPAVAVGTTGALPTLTINNVRVTEGNALGTPDETIATFTVTLSAASPTPVTVNFATTDGSAVAPGDYKRRAGTLTFAAGQTSKPINVIVYGDNVVEPDETFKLNLSVPTGATIADATGLGTITNDEATSNLVVDTASDADLQGCGTAPRDCSLRGAINKANLDTAPQTIGFTIPGTGVRTITLNSPLPAITQPLTINGFSQNPSSGLPSVRIDGDIVSFGLELNGRDSLLKGLIVTECENAGIRINGPNAQNNKVQGCWLGTKDGVTGLGNEQSGIELSGGAHDNLVGGSGAQSNLISGNGGPGVLLTGSGTTKNQILGNFIGTQNDQIHRLANVVGISVTNSAGGNFIGSATQGNVISGNTQAGIEVSGNGNSVFGNLIGEVRNGGALSNGSGGINVTSGSGTIIGNATGGGNTIRHNFGNAVNFGTGVTGATLTGNVISNNTGDAVNISSTAEGVTIRNNQIQRNTGLGINLVGGTQDSRGVTANDLTKKDADPGANKLQNYPTLSKIAQAGIGDRLLLQGRLDSAANHTFVVEVYSNVAPDPSGFGEGETLISTFQATTGADGIADFTQSLVLPTASNDARGKYITLTATDSQTGDTSEFSKALQVPAIFSPLAIVPGSITLQPCASQQFTATLAGIPFQRRVWSVTDSDGNPVTGVISSSGLFSSPDEDTFTVTATSKVTPSATATATVTVAGQNSFSGWGFNDFGSVGNGSPGQKNAPVGVNLSIPTIIAAGGSHSLAVAGGQLYAWGLNSDYQLGLGDQINRATPTQVTNLPGTPTAVGLRILSLAGGRERRRLRVGLEPLRTVRPSAGQRRSARYYAHEGAEYQRRGRSIGGRLFQHGAHHQRRCLRVGQQPLRPMRPECARNGATPAGEGA